MVKGFVQDAVETTAGEVYYRAQASDGRIYYAQEGEGILGWGGDSDGQRSFAAAKSNSLPSKVAERGMSVERAMENVESLQGRRSAPTTPDNAGTLRRALGKEKNRMIGYINAKYNVETEEEWREAVEEYSEFRDEIKDAQSSQERQEIREAYGIGGS